MLVVPYVSVKPNCISMYTRVEDWVTIKTPGQIDNELNLEHNSPNGLISSKASQRIKLAIDWLLLLASEKKVFSQRHGRHFNFKINFVTLTLSAKQNHCDNVIKSQLFSQFLEECKKKWNVSNYLWRAESQRNGNIHFHLVTDKFIPWQELRLTWNRIQNKLGYVDQYALNMRKKFKDGFVFDSSYGKKWGYKQQYTAFLKATKEDWNNPNSTDVHSIKNIKDIAAYLGKYCTKNSKFRKIDGILWRLSNQLGKFQSAIMTVAGGIDDECELLRSKFRYRTKYFDYATVIYMPVKIWSKVANKHLLNVLNEYIDSLLKPIPSMALA